MAPPYSRRPQGMCAARARDAVMEQRNKGCVRVRVKDPQNPKIQKMKNPKIMKHMKNTKIMKWYKL